MITNNSFTILPIQVPTAAVKVMEDDNNDNLRKITEEIMNGYDVGFDPDVNCPKAIEFLSHVVNKNNYFKMLINIFQSIVTSSMVL